MNVLIGDIGGTKTILAICSSEQGPHKLLAEKSFPSGTYDSLEAIISDFLSTTDLSVERACFGVAGPVIDGVAKITNLTWTIDSSNIENTFNIQPVRLLNDMESLAYSIPILESQDIHTLNAGKSIEHGPLALIAPGTGLGEGFLTWENGAYKAHATEGSHTSFGPNNALQIELLSYLHQNGYEHVSFERVCSGGLGIPLLYEFFKNSGHYEEPAWLAEELKQSDDPSPVIFKAAQNDMRECEIAKAVQKMFVSILGSEAGNLALKVLSTGGIYLGGGIPPKILSELQESYFLEAVQAKGRFRELLSKMPVHVILNQKAGLLGAAAFGLSMK